MKILSSLFVSPRSSTSMQLVPRDVDVIRSCPQGEDHMKTESFTLPKTWAHRAPLHRTRPGEDKLVCNLSALSECVSFGLDRSTFGRPCLLCLSQAARGLGSVSSSGAEVDSIVA